MTFIHEIKSRKFATLNIKYAMMGNTCVHCNKKRRMLVMRLKIIDIKHELQPEMRGERKV